MSTYYDFMVEAKYKDKWYNIDLQIGRAHV